VATGAEEMSSSVKEIAKNAAEAAKVATQAVKLGEVTNKMAGKRGESSVEIDKVIKVIRHQPEGADRRTFRDPGYRRPSLAFRNHSQDGSRTAARRPQSNASSDSDR